MPLQKEYSYILPYFNCGTEYLFHKKAHFLGKWSDNLFLGKGIEIVGVKLANLLNRVPISQKGIKEFELDEDSRESFGKESKNKYWQNLFYKRI
jgi:hypothetical protein